MEITERLQLSKVLLGELEKMVLDLNPYDDEVNEIYTRALHAKMKMKAFYIQYGQKSELLEQINLMDSVIKKIEEIKNKRGV